MDSLFIRIPATTANLGPGFDIFGMALNLYNYFHFILDKYSNYEIYNLELKILPFSELSQNLIYQTYKNVLLKFGYKENNLPRWKVETYTDIASGKGFGSSASAIVAGVQIAKKILEQNQIYLQLKDEIDFFLEMENHPDNVVPARLGGWVFCYDSTHIIKKELPETLGICTIIPDFEISTDISRKQLKEYYRREEALSNIKGCLLWLEYIYSKNPEYLIYALASDTLHEPIRYTQIPYIEEIKQFIKEIGCYGMTLSGSGPSLVIYYDKTREEYFYEKLNKLKDLLNHKKKNGFTLKFCSPDYDGLIVYSGKREWEKNIFQNLNSFII